MKFGFHSVVVGCGFLMMVGCGKSSSSSPAEGTTTLSQSTVAARATAPTPPTDTADQGGKFTCYSKPNGLCMRFDDLSSLGEINDARKACAEPGDKFSADPCPTQGLLGTCTEKANGDDPAVTTYVYKSEANLNVAAAKDFCKDTSGVFAPATALR